MTDQDRITALEEQVVQLRSDSMAADSLLAFLVGVLTRTAPSLSMTVDPVPETNPMKDWFNQITNQLEAGRHKP